MAPSWEMLKTLEDQDRFKISIGAKYYTDMRIAPFREN